MHNPKDGADAVNTLNKIVRMLHDITGVDTTHTETAMILANGDVMKYEVAGHADE